MKVIFLGTPEFALGTLEMLIREHEVVLVVTKPDAPKGRGGKIAMPCVKELALKHGIEVYQPASSRTDEFYEKLKNAGADVMVTCAYGKILPARVLGITKYGCVNVHASLLPEYRGAAPLWHTVIDGKTESGITTMLTDAGMDTGDILLCDKTPIGPDMTMGELHDILAAMGPVTLRKTLAGLEKGCITPKPQDAAKATYAPMVDRDTGHIDWDKSAAEIHDLVRGTNPFPTAWSMLDGRRVKIWRTAVTDSEALPDEPVSGPGTCIVNDGTLKVVCGSGIIEILEIQAEGSRKMSAGEYLNGHGAKKFK
ncbi:MAG: methionyl-tRNA formyltransferase [Clostridia bacterium]|nr:methionyl-tRNA formyltransferase [Clostridia bacterium]